MKAIYVVLLVLSVFVSPVVAAPDCPPTPTPPVTAVTLADIDASGPWYVWVGVLLLTVAAWGGAAAIVGFNVGYDKGWQDGYDARKRFF